MRLKAEVLGFPKGGAQRRALLQGDEAHHLLDDDGLPREAPERVVAAAQPHREGQRRQRPRALQRHHAGDESRLVGQNNLHHLAGSLPEVEEAQIGEAQLATA